MNSPAGMQQKRVADLEWLAPGEPETVVFQDSFEHTPTNDQVNVLIGEDFRKISVCEEPGPAPLRVGTTSGFRRIHSRVDESCRINRRA